VKEARYDEQWIWSRLMRFVMAEGLEKKRRIEYIFLSFPSFGVWRVWISDICE
jgi:hypothetical protein